MSLPILELWYTALREPIGIAIPCSDPEKLRARLYVARKQAADPAIQGLMIHTSPRNKAGEVWITHRHIDITREELRSISEDGQGQ